MSGQDFELLMSEAFRLQGFKVAKKVGASADGGVDLELIKGIDRYLVQAKHWRARQVTVEVVRELAGVIPFRRAAGDYAVTSGRFTAPAAKFAEGRGIELTNGSRLAGMLAQARASLKAKGSAQPVRSIDEIAHCEQRPECGKSILGMLDASSMPRDSFGLAMQNASMNAASAGACRSGSAHEWQQSPRADLVCFRWQ